LVRLARRPADVLHLQWLAAPELDARFLRLGKPSVFTAHDLLPRRTAAKRELWHRLLARFDRIVVHSERGRETLAEIVPEERLRVIPHPVFPSDPARSDDGRTLLCFGVIRPYKGLGDAIAAAKEVDGARLLAAAARELLDDPDALEAARAGARRAREQLTWDAAARAHLAVYREIA